MKFDFYLSEMSVSDKHGGGLTLQRILGADLNDIDHFVDHQQRIAMWNFFHDAGNVKFSSEVFLCHYSSVVV